MLQAAPDQASAGQRYEYQTLMLQMMMTYLTDSDVLLSDHTSSTLINNVLHIVGRVADKLWQGEITSKKKINDFTSLPLPVLISSKSLKNVMVLVAFSKVQELDYVLRIFQFFYKSYKEIQWKLLLL